MKTRPIPAQRVATPDEGSSPLHGSLLVWVTQQTIPLAVILPDAYFRLANSRLKCVQYALVRGYLTVYRHSVGSWQGGRTIQMPGAGPVVLFHSIFGDLPVYCSIVTPDRKLLL